MRLFESKSKNILYLLYRIVEPIIDPIKFVTGLYGYLWFLRDLLFFKIKKPESDLFTLSLFPKLRDKISLTPFDSHYYYQQLWVFENVLSNKPFEHVDIGSSYEMSGYLSKIVKTKFVDLRPIDTQLDNLTIEKGNILNLPMSDSSVHSISCLHVIEHIGLGRYGDLVNPDAHIKACQELNRILKSEGKLYLSTPIGRERICFNAHRVFSIDTILNIFRNLKLVSFDFIDDNGIYLKNYNIEQINCENISYGLGMFLFEK